MVNFYYHNSLVWRTAVTTLSISFFGLDLLAVQKPKLRSLLIYHLVKSDPPRRKLQPGKRGGPSVGCTLPTQAPLLWLSRYGQLANR